MAFGEANEDIVSRYHWAPLPTPLLKQLVITFANPIFNFNLDLNILISILGPKKSDLREK